MDALGRNRRWSITGLEDIELNREFDFVSTAIEPGLSVIEASAGTGKTFAISHLVARLLLEGSVSNVSECLLVTFTNDAAAELSERVRRVLEKLVAEPADGEASRDPGIHALRQHFGHEQVKAVMGKALLDLDRLNVSTIHSFCMQVLQTEGTLCGLPVVPDLVPDARELIDSEIQDIWESTVAADAEMAGLAALGNWNLSGLRAFIIQAMAIPGVEFVPAAQPFDAFLQSLRTWPERFDDATCREVGDIAERVIDWNQSAPPPEELSCWLEGLQHGRRLTDPAVLEALEGLQPDACAKWIAKRKKDHKELAEALGSCRLLTQIVELHEQLKESPWQFYIHCYQRVQTAVERALREKRQITYDGLIAAIDMALDPQRPAAAMLAAQLRKRFKLALVDESQDTDPRQFAIFQRIFLAPDDPQRLVLVGDPKQAIYAFRGADVNTYLGARALADGKVFSLTRTFRAPAPLVKAVNAFFQRPASLLKEGLGFSQAKSGLAHDEYIKVDDIKVEARVQAWVAEDEDIHMGASGRRNRRIAAAVAGEISRLLNARARFCKRSPEGERSGAEVRPGDFAVLVNSHKEGEAIGHALRACKVPSVRSSVADVMTTEEAAELLVVLRALEQPRRAGLLLAALATRLAGYDVKDISRVRAGDGEAELEKFSRWQALWLREGVAAALAAMDRELQVSVRLAGQTDGERRLTNLRQLVDLLQAASAELDNQPTRLIRWLAGEIQALSVRNRVEERQMQLESDAEAVQIVTMHAAKGLEYKLVICPFLWCGAPRDAGYHALSAIGQPTRLVDLSLVDDVELRTAIRMAAIEDRIRLAYVAMTRARVGVWLLAGQTGNNGKNSKFHLHPNALDWLLRSDTEQPFADWWGSAPRVGRAKPHRAALNAIADNAEGAIAISALPDAEPTRWASPAATSRGQLAAAPMPWVPPAWSMTSFSALTREKSPYAGPDTATASADGVAETPLDNPANAFAAAPGGTSVGTAIHDWIEHWDFGELDQIALAAHLATYPLPGMPATAAADATFAGLATDMFASLRETVLPGLDCTVAESCPVAGASEWHFQMPLRAGFGAAALAEAFRRHGDPAYAALLGALPVEQLDGYLHGFIDRIALHNGRWGVIDWKTNRLGLAASSYATAALRTAVMHSHYLLQGNLYLIALRRFLGPEAVIAGAYVVFLRGVRAGAADGVFHIPHNAALLEELDGLFEPPMIS